MAKKSLIEQAFNDLVDLSRMFWQVSLFATLLFSVVTLFLAKFSFNVLNPVEGYSPTYETLINSIGWIFYLLPLVFSMVTVFFGVNTLKGYLQ